MEALRIVERLCSCQLCMNFVSPFHHCLPSDLLLLSNQQRAVNLLPGELPSSENANKVLEMRIPLLNPLVRPSLLLIAVVIGPLPDHIDYFLKSISFDSNIGLRCIGCIIVAWLALILSPQIA